MGQKTGNISFIISMQKSTVRESVNYSNLQNHTDKQADKQNETRKQQQNLKNKTAFLFRNTNKNGIKFSIPIIKPWR